MSAPEPRFGRGRHAGVLVPLFSIPSARAWGIGEIGDIPACAAWVREAGHSFVQLLPVTEVASGETSPYSAMSAMAIDPIYISLADIPEFQAIGGEEAASPPARYALDFVRRSRRVRYDAVRALKRDALRAAYERFSACADAARLAAFESFVEREGWWLGDYARFRAIRETIGRPWTEWPEALRRRDGSAVSSKERELERSIRYYSYLQWIADEQWHAARERAGIGLFGDVPFMVGGDSADVWVRQHEFQLDRSVGTPPDAFSETGQNWGLPVYDWEAVKASGDEWFRQRARRSTALYDGYRIDHIVGFYRTYVRPLPDGRPFTPYFSPGDEPSQRAQGERVITSFRSADALVVAEDLGSIPDFVRESLAALGTPGYRVLRWSRDWHTDGHPFIDPASWPARSVGTSGTHDTTPLAEWWETLEREDRTALLQIPALAPRDVNASSPFGPPIRDALLDTILGSGSDLVILPVQDLFGWLDRINTPATIGPHNWTWRLPWPSDRLLDVPESRARARELAEMTGRHGRSHLAFGAHTD
jgi:4-alpha-glucanotransferase